MPEIDEAAAATTITEVEALLALGRLDGALRVSKGSSLRMLAARLVRNTLVMALRQEGHVFSDARFHAWFAGLMTLSDQPSQSARPPRSLVQAILTELAHSPWAPIAELSASFASVLMAPQDFVADDREGTGAYQNARDIIAAARELVTVIAPCPHPLRDISLIQQALANHVTFARVEHASETMAIGPMRIMVDRIASPSPRWAVEILWGNRWYDAGHLTHALPFPGLIRLDRICSEADAASLQLVVASSLRDVANDLVQSLVEMDELAQAIGKLRPGRRNTSRAPALAELLASFGPLRSAQIESLLRASRIGVRSMLASLLDLGMLQRTTVAGVHLYSVDLTMTPRLADKVPLSSASFTAEALDEYNSSMAELDALLGRLGVDLSEGND